jgi:hypothetical protein
VVRLFIVALISSCLLANRALATQSSHRPCQTRTTTFEGWTAEELSNEWVQLTIVKQLGGRLMQVRFAGHPYLFVNTKYKGRYIPPEQANGKWINYGGDKLWPLPEGREDDQHWPGPLSDPLDDGQYDLTVISQSAACAIRLEGPADPRTGLQYSREISLTSDSPQVSFHAIMRNASARSIRWSMQSVTQYDTSDASDPAAYNRNFWAFAEVNPQSSYFTGYQVRNGLADDPSFRVSDGLFKLHWLYLENEVWLDSTAGWLAVVDGKSQFAMVERFQHAREAEYPGKASVIFYKNGAALQLKENGVPALRSADVATTPYYMEAEVNSPMIKLQPGQSYAMDTAWFPTRADAGLRAVTPAGVVLSPVSFAVTGNSLTLAGSFGVFFPGKLRAQLLDELGGEQRSVDLQPVVPETRVDFHREIQLPAQATTISIRLVDEQGVDRGSLAEASIHPAISK